MNTQSTSTRIVAAVLSATMFLSTTACSSGGAGPEATSSKAAAYSGVDTFRGVFFREGPAAGAVAGLWQDSAQPMSASREQQIAWLEHAVTQMKAEGWSDALIAKAQGELDALRAGNQPTELGADEAAMVRELLMARIAESDPTFFDRFGTEMQSGDHLRVEAAMTEAATTVKAALNTLGNDPHTGYQLTNKCVFIIIFIFLVLVLPESVAPTANDSRLGHAERIDLLTRTFAQ